MANDDRIQSGILGDINPNDDVANDHSAHGATHQPRFFGAIDRLQTNSSFAENFS